MLIQTLRGAVVAALMLTLGLTAVRAGTPRVPFLSDAEAQALMLKTLKESQLVLPLGRFRLVEGRANPLEGTINKDTSAWAEAASKVEDSRWQVETISGQTWVTISLPIAAPTTRWWAIDTVESISDLSLTGNEPRYTTSGQFRLVRGEYTVKNHPIVAAHASIVGQLREPRRKAAWLFKWDPENSRWRRFQGVVANASERLDTEPLSRALAASNR